MLYLSNWKTKPVGDFVYATCDACGNDVFTLLVKRRRWITFFSLPLLPTSSASYYHVCPECGATWAVPDDAIGDALELHKEAEEFLDGDMDLETYSAELEGFVEQHGNVNPSEVLEQEPRGFQ